MKPKWLSKNALIYFSARRLAGSNNQTKFYCKKNIFQNFFTDLNLEFDLNTLYKISSSVRLYLVVVIYLSKPSKQRFFG